MDDCFLRDMAALFVSDRIRLLYNTCDDCRHISDAWFNSAIECCSSPVGICLHYPLLVANGSDHPNEIAERGTALVADPKGVRPRSPAMPSTNSHRAASFWSGGGDAGMFSGIIGGRSAHTAWYAMAATVGFRWGERPIASPTVWRNAVSLILC